MNTQCSIALLESALAGNLPADDEDLLHRHLEECAECCAALEHMAGGPVWCQEAAALLARDELDTAVSAYEEWSAVDFTVEHLEPTDEPNVLGRLGGYDVLEIIGRGGMGVVLKGFDRELKRCVAIKVLSPQLAQSSLAKKRFAREAQAAAAVVHPNVLAIHQVQPSGAAAVPGHAAGSRRVVGPTAHGPGPLGTQGNPPHRHAGRGWPCRGTRAGPSASRREARQHPAGKRGRTGRAHRLGLARAADDVTLTRWGVIAGTPQYMSPEQARGEPLDGRSDLFSLGCVLYEMATGVSPFRADSVMATMRRLVDDRPQAMASLNPELPPWIIAIVDRLLDKDPSRRFNSAKEVSELLEGCLAHLQQPTSVRLPAALPRPALRRAWRPRVLGFRGVLVVTAALGITLLGMFLLSTQPPEIAGEWSSGDWGHIVLKKTSDAKYTGTYSDTVGEQPGEIQLKWSRIERRFNGTWHEGEDCFGELSVRMVDGEIRGALTTDSKSRTNPATPRLADLKWTRPGLAQGSNTAAAEITNQSEQSHPNATAGAKTAKEQKEAWRWREHSGLPIEITNSIGMKLVLIPPGEFTMGSPRELIKEELTTPGIEDWYKDRLPGEGPQHLVRISRPFYFSEYLVTQEEYQRVMGTNPSEFSATGNGKGKVAGEDTRRCPVENVSWNDALEFCRKLSNLPDEQSAGRTYQLPSEAQWEYACRAGTTGRFSFSPGGSVVPGESENNRLCDYGWFDGNSDGRTHTVGEKMPNAWGLFDVHGNVWEWCQDWYGKDYYAESPMDDPTGPLVGTYRVCRGGGCRVPAWRCGSASRGNREPGSAAAASAYASPKFSRNVRVESVQGAEGKVEKTGEVKSTPKRMHRFAALTTGRNIKAACSADGKLLAIVNGNPTMIMMGGGRSKAADNWQPAVKILNAETEKTVASLKLTTADEDAVLTGTDRVSHLEATALAFSPDGSMARSDGLGFRVVSD